MNSNRRKYMTEKDNTIFIGRKPTMSYVLAVMTQFSGANSDVRLKARGKSISRAVDVAEVVKNRFSRDVKREINIGTDEVKDKTGRPVKVSTIDIVLRK